jgi:hypothetical protein
VSLICGSTLNFAFLAALNKRLRYVRIHSKNRGITKQVLGGVLFSRVIVDYVYIVYYVADGVLQGEIPPLA